MEKEFVPYELALELKQLGFEEPCLSYYEGESFSYHLASIKGDDYIIPAPLYQQAFRWFREKYNIQSCVAFTISKYKFEIHFQRLADGENPPVMVWHYVDSWLGLNIGLFDAYEEAELACLKKLIEIVKTK